MVRSVPKFHMANNSLPGKAVATASLRIPDFFRIVFLLFFAGALMEHFPLHRLIH